MKKMYCYDCNFDVIPKHKKVKNHYFYKDKEFDVLEDLFYCLNCDSELVLEVLDDQFKNIYDKYLSICNFEL